VIRLLLDQGLPRTTGKHLPAATWNVVHVGDIGLSRATDQQILDYVKSDNRVCVTLDADFHALLATADASRPSVIRIRKEGLQAGALAELLMIDLRGDCPPQKAWIPPNRGSRGVSKAKVD
jgi:predicted nuclease of predicted toxin-antitoxin system